MFIPDWVLIVALICIPGLLTHIYKQGYNEAMKKKN